MNNQQIGYLVEWMDSCDNREDFKDMWRIVQRHYDNKYDDFVDTNPWKRDEDFSPECRMAGNILAKQLKENQQSVYNQASISCPKIALIKQLRLNTEAYISLIDAKKFVEKYFSQHI